MLYYQILNDFNGRILTSSIAKCLDALWKTYLQSYRQKTNVALAKLSKEL